MYEYLVVLETIVAKTFLDILQLIKINSKKTPKQGIIVVNYQPKCL